MKSVYKGLIGAFIGAAAAGGWLYMDLILPEPYGDVLLFALMGIVNGIIGWQVGRMIGKSREKTKALERMTIAPETTKKIRTDEL